VVQASEPASPFSMPMLAGEKLSAGTDQVFKNRMEAT
jgi:hypothetical protein